MRSRDNTDDAQLRNHGQSRRTTPRLEVLDQLHGRLVAVDIPIRIRDISTGGFSVESPISFPAGAVHQFRFTTSTGRSLVVPAGAAHCRTAAPRDGMHWYVTGFEFLYDEHGDVARAVDVLMDSATSVLSFE